MTQRSTLQLDHEEEEREDEQDKVSARGVRCNGTPGDDVGGRRDEAGEQPHADKGRSQT